MAGGPTDTPTAVMVTEAPSTSTVAWLRLTLGSVFPAGGGARVVGPAPAKALENKFSKEKNTGTLKESTGSAVGSNLHERDPQLCVLVLFDIGHVQDPNKIQKPLGGFHVRSGGIPLMRWQMMIGGGVG